jgi:hypothetical protein
MITPEFDVIDYDNSASVQANTKVSKVPKIDVDDDKQWTPGFEFIVGTIPAFKHYGNPMGQKSIKPSKTILIDKQNSDKNSSKTQVTEKAISTEYIKSYSIKKDGYLSSLSYSITKADQLPINKNYNL